MEIRTKILDAAVRVFADAGFRGATTRRIASEAGVNEITIFRHFGSKSALLEQAIGRNAVHSDGPTLPDVPIEPESELRAWARQQLDALRAQRTLIRTCMGESQEHPEMMPPCGTQPARAADALCDYSDRLRQHGFTRTRFDSRAAAAFLMGALFADAVGRDLMPDMYPNQPDQALAEYVRLFLRGIGVSLT